MNLEEQQYVPLEENPAILKKQLKPPTDPTSETPLNEAQVKILYKCRLFDFDTIVDENEDT